jgi:hypothetical protein
MGERSAYRDLVGNLMQEDHWEEPGVDGMIVLRWIIGKWDGDIDWIDLVQDRAWWRAVVNVAMNLWVP